MFPKTKTNLIPVILWLLIFIGMSIFFIHIHPIGIFDTDDWTYISYTRPAFPVWKLWNPTRVFPETFLSLLTTIGVSIFKPLTRDFFLSVTVTHALIVGFCIAYYIISFYNLLCRRLHVEPGQACIITILFFLMHFWVYRRNTADNDYMFHTVDLCCYYYYIIPNLMNAIIVMKLIERDFLAAPVSAPSRPVISGLALAFIYFSLLSNLYASVIPMCYIGAQLLSELVGMINRKRSLRDTLMSNALRLLYFICWCVVQIFEINGGRANKLIKDESFLNSMKRQFFTLLQIRNKINYFFLAFCLVIIVFSIIIMKPFGLSGDSGTKEEPFYSCIRFLPVSLILCFAYIFLVSSKHNLSSLLRADINYGIFFYFSLIACFCLCVVFTKYRHLVILGPVSLLIIVFNINTPNLTFSESNTLGRPYRQCLAASKDIVAQFLEADNAKMKEFTLIVPDYGAYWPIFPDSVHYISNSLYTYGVTSGYIHIKEVKFSKEKYDELWP